jgi:hypothetical protein
MAYVGTPIDTRNTFQSLQGKRFNGDGSTTAFTLDVAPSSTLDIEVFVGNVRQDPNSAYTLSGTTLTFTGAPPSGTNNIYVVHQAKSVGTIDPPATETIAKTFSGATTISGALVASSTAQFDTIGVGAAKDLGTGLHIKTADSGASVSVHADELVVEGSANSGLSILSGASSNGRIMFGDSGDNDIGYIEYDHSANQLALGANAASHIKIDSAGHVTQPNQSAFMAIGHDSTGALSNIATNNSQSDIPFPTEVFDQNGDYNNSNYTFTAPVTGRYLFCYNVLLTTVDSAATYVALRYISSNRSLDINILEPDFNADLSRYTLTGSIIGDLDASDTAKLTIAQYEGTAQMDVGSVGMHFSGCLLA